MLNFVNKAKFFSKILAYIKRNTYLCTIKIGKGSTLKYSLQDTFFKNVNNFNTYVKSCQQTKLFPQNALPFQKKYISLHHQVKQLKDL